MMDKNKTVLPEKFLAGIAVDYSHILMNLIRCCQRDDKFIKSFQGQPNVITLVVSFSQQCIYICQYANIGNIIYANTTKKNFFCFEVVMTGL